MLDMDTLLIVTMGIFRSSVVATTPLVSAVMQICTALFVWRGVRYVDGP
jgi:hypothetical protein